MNKIFTWVSTITFSILCVAFINPSVADAGVYTCSGMWGGKTWYYDVSRPAGSAPYQIGTFIFNNWSNTGSDITIYSSGPSSGYCDTDAEFEERMEWLYYSDAGAFWAENRNSWSRNLSCGNTHAYTRSSVEVPATPEGPVIPENPTPVYAECGRNSTAYSYGTTQYLGSENIDFCAVGTLRGSNPAFPTNAGVMWICEAAGTNRLYDKSCFASVALEPLIPGECGTEPDQCRFGNPEYVPDSETELLWNCRGSNTYGREVPGNLDICSMDRDDYNNGGFDPVCRVSPLIAKVNSPITWSVEGLGSSSANFGFSWFDMYGANDPFGVESQHGQTVQITSPNPVSFINLMVTVTNPFVVPAPTIICPTAKFVDEIIVEMDPPIVDENETCTMTWSKAPSASQCSIYNEEGVSVNNISGLPSGNREVSPGNKYHIGCELMTQPTGFVESERLACMKSGTLIEI